MNDGNNPVVTIFCLCYNHEKFVIESLESVINQTYKDIQIIIADNGSTDSSKDLIEKWIKDKKIDCEFINLSENIGVCRALNLGLKKSVGAYFSMMATDDILLPIKTEIMVNKLKNTQKNVGLVYGDCYLIDEHGNFCDIEGKKTSEPRTFHSYFDFKGKNLHNGNIFEYIVEYNFLHNLSSLIKIDCFQKVGLYDESLNYEDWDMNLRITKNFKAIYIPKVLAKYRRHQNNASINWSTNEKFSISTIRIFLKHYPNSKAVNDIIEKNFYLEIEKISNSRKLVALIYCVLIFFRTNKITFIKLFIKIFIKLFIKIFKRIFTDLKR